MATPDLLKNLKLDHYYMVLVYLGAFLLVCSLFIPTLWLSNRQLGLFALGILCIGLGEWENHKWKSWIKEANAFTGGAALMKVKIREPDFIGYLLNLIGLLFLITGILIEFEIDFF